MVSGVMKMEAQMVTLIKTTQDGRRLEVAGLAILLDSKLEAFELVEVKDHPRARAIWEMEPSATHVAGRVVLTAEEASRVKAALAAAEEEIMSSPAAIEERFRLASLRRACSEGIE